IAKSETLPSELKIISTDDMGEIMAVKHRDYEIYGLQFHPESILTTDGEKLLENFLKISI
ncbi:MAG: aminodeoxychorismate/anthranilate synthase component II, partial [Ruminococcus sp.]